jgi:hypothetical protein
MPEQCQARIRDDAFCAERAGSWSSVQTTLAAQEALGGVGAWLAEEAYAEDVAHRFLERYLELEVQGDVDVGLYFQRYIVLARQIFLMNFFRRVAFHPGEKKNCYGAYNPEHRLV